MYTQNGLDRAANMSASYEHDAAVPCDEGLIHHHIQTIQPCVLTSHRFQKLHSLLIVSLPPIIYMFLLKSTTFLMESSANIEVNDDDDDDRVDQPHFNVP